MFKNVFTIFLVVMFAASLSFAQSKNWQAPKAAQKVMVDDSKSANVVSPNVKTQTTYPVVDPAAGQGDVVGETQYPYFSNSVVRQQIVVANGLPHMAPMIWPNSGGNRSVTYVVSDGTNYTHYEIPAISGAANNRTGWPAIDYPKTGALAGSGIVGVVAHVPCALYLWDGSSFSTSTEIEANSDPSLLMVGDKIFSAVSGNRAKFQFYESADFGLSFANYDSIEAYSPSPIYWVTNGGVEVDMFKSPDEMYIGMLGSNANDGHVDAGIAKANADVAWMIYSTDGGATWTGKSLGFDGDVDGVASYAPYTTFVDSVVVTLPDGTDETVAYNQDVDFIYRPLFENFGQVHGAVGNDGVFHVVANGYGQLLATVTAQSSAGPIETEIYAGDSFPVLYWNSNMGETNGSPEWMAISDRDMDLKEVTTGADVAGFAFPGNGIGQAFPQIATSEDGQVLYCTWTSYQLNASMEIDTAANTGATWWTDAYHAFSVDGGANWTYGETLVDDPAVSEFFAHPDNLLEEIDATTYRAHILFVEDLPGGGFQNTTGTGPVCNLRYKTFDIVKTSVEEDLVGLADSYNLEQNYPNPFNPSTTIKYAIPEQTNVVLKVYDVLGNEVATLIDDVRAAGSYEVNFNASDLASGMYVYKLTAGNFTSTQKMMLLK